MLSVKWVSTHEAKTTPFSYHSNYQQTRIHSTSSWWSGPTPPGLYSIWFAAFLWRESPHSRRGWGPADTFGKTSRASGLLSAEKEDTMGTDINSLPDWERSCQTLEKWEGGWHILHHLLPSHPWQRRRTQLRTRGKAMFSEKIASAL